MLPRAQLAEQKRQFNERMDLEKNAQKQAGYQGMIGTAGNLGMLYMLGKNNGLFGSTINPTITQTATTTPAVTGGGSVGMGVTQPLVPTTQAITNSLSGVTGTGQGLSPFVSQIGLIESGIASGLTESGSTAGVGATSGSSILSSVSPIVAPVGVGLLSGQLGKSGTGKDIGKAMLFGGGGEKEQAAAAGGAAGALGGAAIGAQYGSILGLPGAAVGAVIGGIVGAVSSLVDSHICTATREIVGMSKAEISKMKALKKYALKYHKGWLASYLDNGQELVGQIILREYDSEKFFMKIRKILIEPRAREEDMEKCFQIYLKVTKKLFKKYMPDFEFKEKEAK
jgi:hypothetical protein